MQDAEDKRQREWAKNYILDPLTQPEPSQETGPGSSFFNPLRRTLSTTVPSQGKQSAARAQHHKNSSSCPTPPSSASPTRLNFHQLNPFSSTHRKPLPPSPGSPQPSPRIPLLRGNSVKKQGHQLVETYCPQNSNSNIGRSKTVATARRPPQTHHTQGHTQGASSVNRSVSVSTPNDLDKGKGLRRTSSLSGRYPGDMSHRPLDQIKREQRAADRSPHLKNHKYPNTDTIDSLDATSFGGAYHHGGPYDATLASRNQNKLYSPVEAVKDSNEQALRATPREYIEDSLRKHVPLRGTATIPPGHAGINGQIMDFEDGTDMMRDPQSAAGARGRWEHISYQDDDLKGKGEPSYTYEKDLKERKSRARRQSVSHAGVYEMQPLVDDFQNGNTRGRHRSLSATPTGLRFSSYFSSHAGPSSPSRLSPTTGISTNNDVNRSNTTGKKLSEGLKRRFGSLRRRKHSDE